MRTLEHPTLGEVEVIVEVMENEKHFYLVRQKMITKITSNRWRVTRKLVKAKLTDRNSKMHHYCMWGNTNIPEEMGTTHILTNKGTKVQDKMVNRYFFELVNASKKLNFAK